MEPILCGPNPDFLGTTANFGVLLPEKWFLAPHQTQCFAFGSVGAQTVSLHNIPTLYDRLGHTLCKGLLEPNFWLQGPLFCDCYFLYNDISDGMFHDPHCCGRSSRVYPKNFDRRISKNYLVRREMACRERRTRPPAFPRQPKLRPYLYHPSVNFSWETIRELLQLHHFFQANDIRGRFFSLYPTNERECEPKCKIGISLISEFIQSSKSFPMKLRNALVR